MTSPGAGPAPANQNEPRASRRARALVAGVFALMSARLLWMIWSKQVNMLYYDEFDLYHAFAQHDSWLRLFMHQPGPHREGPSFILMSWVAALSHWNTRAMSFTSLAIEMAAAGCALALKRRLFGALVWSDIAVPLLFLAPIQYEDFLGAANLGTTTFPILLVVVYALAWTIESQTRRYAAILLLNFLLIFSGYGFFMGLITPCLLAMDLMRRLRAKESPTPQVVALLIALASLASFFINYQLLQWIGCLAFQRPPLVSYPWFMAVMFANLLRLKGSGIVVTAAGAALIVLAVLLALRYARRALAGPQERNLNQIMLALAGFSLLYSANAAVGRICFGVEYGQASRYAPYLFPVFLAFYFALLQLAPGARRKWLVAAYTAALAIAAVFVAPRDRRTMDYYRDGKQAWRACYLRTGNPVGCTQQTGFQIYPEPGSVRMRQMLEYMKQNHLNLYSSTP